MTHKILLIIFTAVFAGAPHIYAGKRQLKSDLEPRAITVNSVVNVIYTPAGSGTEVMIEASEKVIKNVNITISRTTGELSITYNEGGTFGNNEGIVAYVRTPHLSTFNLSGAASISVKERLDIPDNEGCMTIMGTGASSFIAGDIATNQLEVHLSGASSVRADKLIVSSTMNIIAEGAALFDAKDVNAKKLILDSEGAARVNISNAYSTVAQLSATGGAAIAIKGTAKEGWMEASGAASINAENFSMKKPRVQTSGIARIYFNKKLHTPKLPDSFVSTEIIINNQ